MNCLPECCCMEFQLTHSRGVRRYAQNPKICQESISTHALTWSATHMCIRQCAKVTNFNSRTHVECDIGCDTMKSKHINFNSRTHVECDCTVSDSRCAACAFQITHSRGVRLSFLTLAADTLRFQLTHSRGVRRCGSPRTAPFVFQLTHSRGVRPGSS